jgi:PAS domain S-box-containing protein
MANAAPVMVWVADENGTRTFFNKMWLQFAGRRSPKELADTWMVALHPDDRRRCLGIYSSALRNRKRFRIEYRMKRYDGTYRWILETGTPNFTPVKIFVGHVGSAIDITKAKRAKELEVGQKKFLELVARGRPFAETLSFVTRFIHEQSNGASCTIMTLDDTGKLRLSSSSTLPDSFKQGLYEVPLAKGNGSCAVAALRRRITVVSDIETNSVWHNLRNLALDHRFYASTSVPVVAGSGEILGTCAIYYHTKRSPHRHDVQLMRLFSQLLAITFERRQAEEALEKAEQQYRSIFENAVEGIFQTTPEGRFIAANPAMARMLGFESPQELMADRFDIERQHYVEPERRAEFERLIQAQGIVERFELEVYRKDGTKIWTSENVRLVKDDSGKSLYYEGTVENITKRKNAERALKASEERFRRYFELGLIGMAITSPTKRMIEVNDRICTILGYDREELTAKTWAELTHPADLTASEAEFERVLAGDVDGYEAEKRYIRKDSQIVYARISVRCLRRMDGSVAYFVGLLEDISDRKRAEQAQRQLMRRLVFAQEAEQRRLSLELHDHMGQSLAALMLGLKSMGHCGQSEQSIEQLAKLEEITTQLAADVHTLATQLRPPALDDLGLQAALTNYVQEWSKRSAIEADFHCNGLIACRLSPIIETTIYRIVQEALTNVLKHANARTASIIVEHRGGRVRAIIEDDGRGFETDALANRSAGNGRLGVLGMHERAALVGGKLNIDSRPSGGTTVIVQIPTLTGSTGE